mgnify:CR=1 FL=1
MPARARAVGLNDVSDGRTCARASACGATRTAARATGAAWVGTESYGVLAQLNDEHRTTAPLLQVVERDRYWASDPARPDFSRPGLIVDLSRRLAVGSLRLCFADVRPEGEVFRAGGLTPNQRYGAFLVSGPRRDIWTRGCPDEITPGVWR